MANALARLGIKVTYIGALGYPHLHPVFAEFARRAEVHSIAEPGRTDALEFDDGKLMLTKTTSMNDITWDNIQLRYGRGKFIDNFSTADFVGFVNWTMVPYMSDLWNPCSRSLSRHARAAPQDVLRPRRPGEAQAAGHPARARIDRPL